MERRALVVALALTLPLALYGIPFGYAAATQSTYAVATTQDCISNACTFIVPLTCNSPSDYSLQYGVYYDRLPSDARVDGAIPTNSAGLPVSTNEVPNGWRINVVSGAPEKINFAVICQSPIPLTAGIGVPEFGSLYAAIALGAVLYFMMARRYARRSAVLAQNKA
jgi:hypothetical protein